MALYLLAGVLVGLLALVVTAAFVIGVLGAAGLIRLVRCPGCAHMFVLSRDNLTPTCPYCNSGHLAHALVAIRHPRRELLHH